MSEKKQNPASDHDSTIDSTAETQIYFDDFNVKAANAVLGQLTPEQIQAMSLTFIQAMLDRQKAMHDDMVEILEAVRVGLKKNELLLARIEANTADLLEEPELEENPS